jgi:hypothetical protein
VRHKFLHWGKSVKKHEFFNYFLRMSYLYIYFINQRRLLYILVSIFITHFVYFSFYRQTWIYIFFFVLDLWILKIISKDWQCFVIKLTVFCYGFSYEFLHQFNKITTNCISIISQHTSLLLCTTFTGTTATKWQLYDVN